MNSEHLETVQGPSTGLKVNGILVISATATTEGSTLVQVNKEMISLLSKSNLEELIEELSGVIRAAWLMGQATEQTS